MPLLDGEAGVSENDKGVVPGFNGGINDTIEEDCRGDMNTVLPSKSR